MSWYWAAAQGGLTFHQEGRAIGQVTLCCIVKSHKAYKDFIILRARILAAVLILLITYHSRQCLVVVLADVQLSRWYVSIGGFFQLLTCTLYMLFKNRIFGKKLTCTYFPKYYPGVVRSIHLVFKGLQYNNQVLVKSRKVSRRLKLHIQNGTYNAPSNKTRDSNKKWPPGISRIIEFSRYRKWHKNHFHTRENI